MRKIHKIMAFVVALTSFFQACGEREEYIYDLPVITGEVEGRFRNRSMDEWVLSAPEVKLDFSQFRKLAEAEGLQVYVSVEVRNNTEVRKTFYAVMKGGEVLTAVYVVSHDGWLVRQPHGNKVVFFRYLYTRKR